MELLRKLSEKKCLLERRIHAQVTSALEKVGFDIPNDAIANSSNYSQVKEAFNVADVNLDLIEHSIASILTPIITCTYQDPVISSNAESTVSSSNPSAVTQTEANRAIKEEPVEENVTVSVAIAECIPNQVAQIVTVSGGVVKEEQTESTVVQHVHTCAMATNVPAAEQQDQLTVESLMDRNKPTHQVPIEIVTVSPDDVKEEPTVENTVQQVVPITTVATQLQTGENVEKTIESLESIQDVHQNLNEKVTVQPAAPNEQILDLSIPATKVSEPIANIEGQFEQTNFRRSGRVSRKRRLSLSTEREPQPKKKNTRRSAPAQPIAATRPTTTRPSQGAPLVCPDCGKVYKRSGDFAKHLRTHTGEKPYRCIWTGCGFSASDRSNVARHVRVIHLNLPVTKKEQRERGIVEERDERDFFIKV